jgi:isopropylmalate/homocitrate/citramalate synthase
MKNMPWKTDQWFTSPWNFAGEVRESLSFPPEIKIHDVTLRDGEQQARITFRREEKVEIARLLDKMGVHRIEAGMPAVSPQDEAAIKEIVDLGLKAEIFAFSRCMLPDVQKAAGCGVSGIVVEIPSSEHIIRDAYGWPLEKAVKLSIEATLAAKEAGLYTVFFPIDASRADIGWFLDLIERIATEGHMDALAVVDTFGVLNTHAIPYLIQRIRERIAQPLEPHFHSDFSLGVSNTLAALACGCSVAHTTVTGIGERAGNTPMEEVVLALKTMYGIDIGIDTTRFAAVSRRVCELAKHVVPANRPIVGERLYHIESGIIASWVKATREEKFLSIAPFRPALTGLDRFEIVMGKNSGIDSVNLWLEELGKRATEEEKLAMVPKVKAKALDKKDLLTREEFLRIYESVVKR